MNRDLAEMIQPGVVMNAFHILGKRLKTMNLSVVSDETRSKHSMKANVGSDIIERHTGTQLSRQSFLDGRFEGSQQVPRVGLAGIEAEASRRPCRHNPIAILEERCDVPIWALQKRDPPENFSTVFDPQPWQAADQTLRD